MLAAICLSLRDFRQALPAGKKFHGKCHIAQWRLVRKAFFKQIVTFSFISWCSYEICVKREIGVAGRPVTVVDTPGWWSAYLKKMNGFYHFNTKIWLVGPFRLLWCKCISFLKATNLLYHLFTAINGYNIKSVVTTVENMELS